MMYSSKTDRRGRVMYFKENKLVAKADIPEGEPVRDMDLDGDVERIDAPQVKSAKVAPEVEPIKKECVVCGGQPDRLRFINNRMIHLCEDHYNDMTVGEIAQVMREKQLA